MVYVSELTEFQDSEHQLNKVWTGIVRGNLSPILSF